MLLKNRQFFLVLFITIGAFISKGQSLYWIGGSGNFNDPAHWSLKSGGSPANVVPNSAYNVVFDEQSASGYYSVSLLGNNSVKALKATAITNVLVLNGSESDKLFIGGSFSLSPMVKYEARTDIYFESKNQVRHIVDFGLNTLKCNLSFGEGNYGFYPLLVSGNNTITLKNGIYAFEKVTVTAGSIVNNDPTATFIIESSYFKASDKFILLGEKNTEINNLYLVAQINNHEKYYVSNTLLNSKKLSQVNYVNTICPISITTTASCSGPCSGVLSINLGTVCNDPPYSVLVSNTVCGTTASSLSTSGLGTPTVYLATNACSCSLNYQVIVFDNSGDFSVNTVNFLGNPITITANSVQPSCSSSCNGTMTGLIFGTSPFTVVITPTTVPSFTTALQYTLNNLCAGVYTYNVTDLSGCTSIQTRTLNGPAPIIAGSSSRSLTCNSVNNGAFSVAPTGGTGTYTVAFSSGGTFSTTTGGTVSVGSLSAGPISATVTDSNGCTATTSANITQPTTIIVTPTQTNLTCASVCNGAASVAVSGGGGTYNYTWSPSGGNAAGATSLCAGGYTVTILDNFGCTTTRTFSITQPTSITLTSTLSNLSCNAVCNGSAIVSASGPTSAVSFTWLATGGSVISLTNNITGRCAGNYTVIARDATSPATCVTTRTITLTQPPAYTITPLTQSISCATLTCSGAATVNASGSNGAPFTYSWTPGGQTTSVVSSMCAGSYTVTVRDPSNCAITTTINIAQPTTFTPAISTASVACNGSCTGIINVTPSGGTAPYSYTLIGGGSTLTSAPPFTNRCAGNYTLFIRDSGPSTCAQVFTTSIQQAPALVPSISTTSITCFNSCNGSLGANATGGTPTYSYTWSTPSGTASGASLTNRCAGVYTLTARDANNCTVSATSTLTQPSDMTVSISSTSVTCFSSCNGVLSGNVSGGTPGYTLTWSNGFTGNPNINRCAGNYTLTVTDLNSCTKTATASVASPSAIVLTRTATPASCAGGCNGSATVTASGGTPPFLFSFNSATPAVTNTTGIISGLCAGNYIASVTDANSCPTSTVFSITSPTLLSAAITGTQNSCTTCSGAGTVQASGGTPGYTYLWTNSVAATVGTASAVSSLCAGNYTVTVTDSQSCIATTTVNIQQTVISAAVSGGTGILCFGACTGSAVVSPSGGTAPYNFTWTPSAQNTQTATNLCTGNYTVTVKEAGASGCTSTATINITTPSSITASASQTSLSCFGVCNGAITASATGGTGTKSFSWSPGGQTTSSITGLCAGSYTLRVTDVNGCTITPQTFSITQPTSITATFSNTTPTGCTLSNGSICVTASGGSGSGYTYTWSPTTGSSSCLTGLSAGAYSIIIADGAGCTRSLSTVLNSPAGPTITASQQSVTCFGASTGSALINAAGTAPFSFTWTPSAVGTTVTGASSLSVTSLPGGTFLATVRDGNSCVTNQSIVITQPSSLTVTSNVVNSKCAGGTPNGSIVITPTGATLPYTYSWTGPSLTATTQNVTGLGPGNYSLTITDAQLCAQQFTYSITAPPAITLNVTSTRTVVCSGSNNGSITASATGGTLGMSYTWTALPPFSGSTTATVLNLGPGVYTVTAIDGNSCVSTPGTWTLAASTLSTSVTQQSATCSNSCNASATLNVSGGAPTFSYSWSSGPSTASVLSNLCVGNYTGSVVDGNGCVSQTGFTVVPASQLSITALASQPKCNAICDGSVAVTPSGAIGTVNYSWSPSGSGQNPTGLCAGIYTVVAIDGNTCSATAVITLTNPPALLANVTTTNPLCNNNCNGIAVINPTNAVGAVTVTWQPTGPPTQTNTGLCAGTYTAIIQDANGCQNTQTFALTNPPALNINSSTGPASCGLSNGSITLIPGGGTPGYTYNWNPNVSTTVSASGLAAQIYTIIVTDAANCSNTITIPLSNSNGPVASVSSTNVLCFGQNNGAASVGTLSGGTPPYVAPVWISPPPNNTVNTITGLTAGNYSVQLEDNLGCKTFTGVTITQPSSISVNPNMGLPTCNGVCNGSITINASGGVPSYSYSWTPSAPASSVLTGLCAGNYTLLITHNSGSCSESHTFNVPGQVNLTFTNNITQNICFGDCNGIASVSVIPTPGIPSPFAFSWSNGQTGPGPFSSSANNLCNGIYSVTATGANGCFNVYTVNITSPSQLTLATAVVQPNCNQCNGGATVTPGGGSGTTYTINWSNGPTTNTITNLCAGIYQVTVMDNVGCSRSNTVIVDNSSGITGHTVTTQDIPCGATCTGAATIVASGTNLPISYNWVSPAISGTVANNLCPGTYFVQMQDAQGCLRNASLTINAATNITLSPFINPPACGLTNGTINLVTTGGSPSYSFNWTPSGPNSGTLTNVGPGSYTITVTDSSPGGCATFSVFNISNLNAPLVSLSQANINCFNACTGSIQANVTGTATPFIYSWSGGGNTSSLTGLCKGVITVTVTDSNTCIAVNSATLNDNPQLQINLPNITQPTCGQCNGSVTVSALGGAGPYTYSWTSGGSGASQGSLCAGLYQVLVTDNLNCQETQNVIINNSNGITGETFSVQNVPCITNCNGGISVTPIGGSAPVSFAWINPVLSSTSSSVTGLCAGVYFVKMTDAQGCTRTSSAAITAASDLTLNASIIQPGCGQTNGIINLQVSGGTPAYTFSWSPGGATTSSVSGLAPGTYTVVVTDQNGSGCSETQNFNLNNLNGPSVTFTQNNIPCFGQCNGSVIVVATGTAATTFTWNTGSNTANSGTTCAGVITLTASANGCNSIRSFTIEEAPQLEFNFDFKPISCLNSCDGRIAIQAIGGQLAYTFGGTTPPNSSLMSSLCVGFYTLSVTDANGCMADSVIQLKNPAPITTTLNSLNSSCSSVADGSASVITAGGTPGYNYLWSGPSSFTSGSNSIQNIFAGTYTLSVTDTLGCRKDSVLRIITTVTIDAVAGPDTLVCPGNSVALNGINSQGVVNYQWFLLPNTTATVANTASFVLNRATESYTFQLLTTSSAPGCFDRDTVVVTAYTVPYIDAGPSFTIPLFSTVTIGGNPTTGGVGTVTWTPTSFLNDANLENPVSSPTIATIYTVSMFYGNGCIASDTMMVEIYPEIRINSGFSPNNDSKNDRWIIDYLDQFPENTVEVFNRWGDRLFYSRGYAVPWDGKFQGKDLPVGTYYYVIHLNHPAYPKPYTGPVTIFR